MKKLWFLIIVIIAVIGFICYQSRMPILNNKEALKIGEDKYLSFLWMVDGAFNDERLGRTYTVNNKKIDDNNKTFKCVYDKNKKKCVSDNFEKEFAKLFSKALLPKNVYSDSVSNSWYMKKDNEDVFMNIDTCNINRMSENHELKVNKIERSKITYQISFKEKDKEFNKLFVLVYEDGDWKIRNAYYHDLCGMDYNIR